MRGVTHEDCFIWLVAELLEGEADREGVGLVDEAGILADLCAHETVEAKIGERPVHHLVALAGHHAHRVAESLQLRESVFDARVLAHESVVVLTLKDAIPAAQLLHLLVGVHVVADLGLEGSAESGDPLRVGGPPVTSVESVPGGLEQELDGVHQRSVEIEQDRVGALIRHGGKTNPGVGEPGPFFLL